MTTITIPKHLSRQAELIVVPRSDYEEFSVWQRKIRNAKIYRPTPAEKRTLARARANYKKGNFVFLKDL
ncbi:MAG: hypothetical protein AAB699_01515 [Patescibacteria group bacterium]